MINHFIFTVGLPGCGKSTYINNNYKYKFSTQVINIHPTYEELDDYSKNHEDEYLLVSADYIKETLPDYDPVNPELVHKQSVNSADLEVRMFAQIPGNFNIIMDGGGLNNHYTQDIIEFVKEHNPSVKITCIFFDTPINICMERVNKRERKIPEHAFYDKNLMISDCIYRYQKLADEYIRVDYFTNKHIFLDMDGTIVSYRKGKLDSEGNTDFVNSHLFINAAPVNHVIDFVKENFDMKNVYIITAVANNIVLDEKLQWMKKYFPEFNMENFLWVGNKQYKHVFLDHFSRLKKMKKEDMTIIDDMHETLHKCTAIGMNAIHPSNIYAITDKFSTLG